MPCLKPPKREGECAPSVRKGRCWVALHWAGTARATSPLDGDARICTTEPEETKHPVLQRRRLVAERSSVRGWQDLRAVHDSRGLCSEKIPFVARSSRGVFPKGDLQGISDTWRANLAANWRFSRPRPLSGCMERKTCHGLPPGNAFREHFAIVERPGNAYSQRLANRAASSCGRAYCLAIALVPHESDDLFVQAVLCT